MVFDIPKVYPIVHLYSTKKHINVEYFPRPLHSIVFLCLLSVFQKVLQRFRRYQILSGISDLYILYT
jgi:hypothetical protein